MDKNRTTPLILIFSPHEKIRNIISAGLLQGNYQVMEAATSYIAGIKANQYIPDLILADITKNNFKDFLFLSRLERSTRTRYITVLISVTADVRRALDKIHEEVTPVELEEEEKRVHLIEYPFNFNTLVKKINELLADKLDKFSENATESPFKSKQRLGERLFDSQVPVQKKLKVIESTIQKQWVYPFIVIRSLEIIGSEKSCCNELAKCIKSDLAATSAILSMSNKITYASRYNRISSVQDAVIRIGFNETRNILASLALIELSSESYIEYGFKRSEFWMHSLATAIIAEQLCRHIKFERPESAFITGLLHDIGKIPVDTNFSDVFLKLLEETTNNINSFHITESLLMGFTHTDVGHFFTTKWNFPNYITLAILNHHTPEKILATKIPMDRILQESVYVANIFAKAMSMGHSCDEVLCEIPAKILKELQIQNGPTNTFIDKAYTALKRYYEYLKLSDKDVTLYVPQANTKENEVFVITGEKKQFHPLILGLKEQGYRVDVIHSLPESEYKKGRVAIFIPDSESPLDIVLTADEDDDEQVKESTILKIFLLEGIELEDVKKDLSKSNIIMMDSRAVDLRLVLQIIEDYHYATSM